MSNDLTGSLPKHDLNLTDAQSAENEEIRLMQDSLSFHEDGAYMSEWEEYEANAMAEHHAYRIAKVKTQIGKLTNATRYLDGALRSVESAKLPKKYENSFIFLIAQCKRFLDRELYRNSVKLKKLDS